MQLFKFSDLFLAIFLYAIAKTFLAGLKEVGK